MKSKVSDLISFINKFPKGRIVIYKNGTLQTYNCNSTRGNLYINGKPVLNYYVDRPGEIDLSFWSDNQSRISSERFTFKANESISNISKVAKKYPVSKQIELYLYKLLKLPTRRNGGKSIC